MGLAFCFLPFEIHPSNSMGTLEAVSEGSLFGRANTFSPPDPSILIQRKIFIVTHTHIRLISNSFLSLSLYVTMVSASTFGLPCGKRTLACRRQRARPMTPHARVPTAPPSLLRHMATKHPTLQASFSTILNNSEVRATASAHTGCVKG